MRLSDHDNTWRTSLAKYNFTSYITTLQLVQIIPAMLILAADLKTAIQNTSAIVDEMDRPSYLNFALHVILKGENFYYSSIADPGFCLYLLPDLYHKNLLQIIRSITGIKKI